MFHTNDIIDAITEGLEGINHLKDCIAYEEDNVQSPAVLNGTIIEFNPNAITEFLILVKTCPSKEETEFFEVINQHIKLGTLDKLIEQIKEVPLYNDVLKQLI